MGSLKGKGTEAFGVAVHRSPFTVHRSAFNVRRSTFGVHRSSLIVRSQDIGNTVTVFSSIHESAHRGRARLRPMPGIARCLFYQVGPRSCTQYPRRRVASG
jgi:hypothetical protein